MNKYTPFRNLILVKPLEKEAKTGTGIILPDTRKNKYIRLEVVRCGPDVKEVLLPGEIILCENMVEKLDDTFSLIQSTFLVVREEQNGN